MKNLLQISLCMAAILTPFSLLAQDSDGIEVGVITSGTFSPTLKNGIALALLDSSVSLGTMVVIDVRGRASQAEVVSLPFVESHVR
mgnify:CR=1 FL=1